MPRKAVYLLITKSGPSRDEQLKAIRRVVPLSRSDEIYADDMTEKYRRKDRHFEQRSVALNQLRQGDILVVASPGRLGIGRDDVRGVLHRLHATKHPLLDASTGKTVLWSEEVADAVAFLDRATVEHKAGAAANAREIKAALGRSYSPGLKALAVTDAEARQMWYDQVRYPSQQEISERCGVSTRTLYKRFGQRSPEAPLKRKKRK